MLLVAAKSAGPPKEASLGASSPALLSVHLLVLRMLDLFCLLVLFP